MCHTKALSLWAKTPKPVSMKRSFDRTNDQMRPITFEVGVNRYAEGSCLVSFGHTKVLCTASYEKSVPPFLKGSGKGWVTAEYSMLPRATHTRVKRERDKVGGRTAEIQRFIGRGLRAAIDFPLLGECSILIDCDVMQADGGTRTASITGAYVALAIAIKRMQAKGSLSNMNNPLRNAIAAVSVGMKDGVHLLDLDYEEDSACEVDMNVIMTGAGEFVEVQGTAESKPFAKIDLDQMTLLAANGLKKIITLQEAAIEQGINKN
jgi:ribonuclease PH